MRTERLKLSMGPDRRVSLPSLGNILDGPVSFEAPSKIFGAYFLKCCARSTQLRSRLRTQETILKKLGKPSTTETPSFVFSRTNVQPMGKCRPGLICSVGYTSRSLQLNGVVQGTTCAWHLWQITHSPSTRRNASSTAFWVRAHWTATSNQRLFLQWKRQFAMKLSQTSTRIESGSDCGFVSPGGTGWGNFWKLTTERLHGNLRGQLTMFVL